MIVKCSVHNGLNDEIQQHCIKEEMTYNGENLEENYYLAIIFTESWIEL